MIPGLDRILQHDLAMRVKPRWRKVDSHIVVLYDRTAPLNVTKRCMENPSSDSHKSGLRLVSSAGIATKNEILREA